MSSKDYGEQRLIDVVHNAFPNLRVTIRLDDEEYDARKTI